MRILNTKHGKFSLKQINQFSENLIGQVFSLLPKKESGYENLDHEIDSIILKIKGLNRMLNMPPELITVICLLEAARDESDFQMYRKAILDSCAIIRLLVSRLGD